MANISRYLRSIPPATDASSSSSPTGSENLSGFSSDCQSEQRRLCTPSHGLPLCGVALQLRERHGETSADEGDVALQFKIEVRVPHRKLSRCMIDLLEVTLVAPQPSNLETRHQPVLDDTEIAIELDDVPPQEPHIELGRVAEDRDHNRGQGQQDGDDPSRIDGHPEREVPLQERRAVLVVVV